MNYVPFWTKLASLSDLVTSLILPMFSCYFAVTSILYLTLVNYTIIYILYVSFTYNFTRYLIFPKCSESSEKVGFLHFLDRQYLNTSKKDERLFSSRVFWNNVHYNWLVSQNNILDIIESRIHCRDLKDLFFNHQMRCVMFTEKVSYLIELFTNNSLTLEKKTSIKNVLKLLKGYREFSKVS